MNWIKKVKSYELIAGVTGFGLLTYELIAARLLAPSIGSSIYVWTSVIGVIIAALSYGYSVGGKMADKRVNPMDVVWLLIASGTSVAITIFLTPSFLAYIGDSFTDPRIQGLIASLVLFAPTSFILGVVSPYLARLRVESVKTAGTSIASLNTFNAIGSIAGTFCTGFIFMAYIGSNETLAVVSILFTASSWLITPRKELRQRIVATLLSLVLVFLLYSVVSGDKKTEIGMHKSVDTPTASYVVKDIFYNLRPVRVLMSGPGGYQSGVYLDGDKSLVFGYANELANVVDNAPKKSDILILGGGAYTLPEHLAAKYPKSTIDVVELDTHLAKISTQYFDYKPTANINDYHQDARSFLNTTNKKYDVILVDVFSDALIPFSVSTVEYAHEIKRSLTEDGIVAINFIGSTSEKCEKLTNSMLASYEAYFQNGLILPVQYKKLDTYQNMLFAFQNTQDSNPKEELGQILGDKWVALPDTSRNLITLSDNFSPTEHMQAVCRN